MGNFNTIADLKTFVQANIKDKRPAKISADNMQTVILGIVDLLTPATFTLNANGSYAIPANTIISAIVVECASNFSLSIGTTNGGNEIAADVQITAGKREAIMISIDGKITNTIYLSGIIASTQFTIIKNSL